MRGLATFAPIGALLATASARPSRRSEYDTNNNTESVNGFADIKVTKELTWVKCFEKFTCTNLEVPLDYEDEAAGTTNIAYIKLQGGDGSGPDVLFNPGGPGESGVMGIVGAGEEYLKNFGGNYNIIGFDPRGVNNSGPALTCFPGAPEQRTNYGILSGGGMNAPLNERYQLARAAGERCSSANAETFAKYAGTLAVVQDMNHFIQLNAASKNQKPEEAKFYYYGISYGTVIGQTLAATYPDKIERMILDGNVYAEEHYKGDVRSSVGDTDVTVRSFFTNCALAGPEKCEFATEGATAEDLELRYKNILQKLEDEPLVISGLDQKTPSVITRITLELFTFQNTYQPRSQFPTLAKVFSEIEAGNSSALVKAQSGGGASVGQEAEPDWKAPYPSYSNGEGLQLITCIDVAGRSELTREGYTKLVRELKEKSYYGGGPMSAGNALQCVGMSILPPKSQLFPGFKETKTKNPILFVNTLRDPVTPHSSAVKASKFFPGSVILAQDTTGHGFVSVKSDCTIGHVQTYMEKAELPKEGTICSGDVTPLVDPVEEE